MFLEAPPRRRREIAAYFGALLLMLGLADPRGLVHLSVLFTLKDALGLRPPAIAVFEALAAMPVLFGILSGFFRDRLAAWGFDDRRLLLLSAPIAASGYLWLATTPPSFAALLSATLLIMVAFQCMDAFAQGWVSVVARRDRMTGRVSALSELAEVSPQVLALLLGGWLSTRVSPAVTFTVAAVITFGIVLQAFWRPEAIFARESAGAPAGEGSTVALRRLLRHPPLWPSLAILVLWNFAPGWDTPFLYYLSDRVGISREAFGVCKAVNLGCVATTALAYGVLCQHQPLRRSLTWGVIVNILPGGLFLLIHGAPAAIVVSAIVGIACGLGNVAVFDLLLRSCPKDLEGSAMMLGFAALAGSQALADVSCSFLYERGGFWPCLALDAVATLCILPVMGRLPADVLDARDSEWADAEGIAGGAVIEAE